MESKLLAEATLAGALTTFEPLAVPDKRGRVGVPARDGGVEPGDQVVLGLGMVALKRTSDQDALDGFSEPMLLHVL